MEDNRKWKNKDENTGEEGEGGEEAEEVKS